MQKKDFEWDNEFYSFFDAMRNECMLTGIYTVDIRWNANIFRVRNGERVVAYCKLVDGKIVFSKKLKG
jgi:hypothetical protein